MDKTLILSGVLFLLFIDKAFLGVQAVVLPTECKDYNALQFIACLSYCTATDATCEAHKNATCHIRTGKCNQCEVYFKYNHKEVECNPRKKFTVCNETHPEVECGDPCKATVCRLHKGAPCRFDNCGGCNTEYFVKGRWRPCPPTDIQSSGFNPGSVHATHKTTCPKGNTPLTCSSYTCDQSSCAKHPTAKCIPDSCDNCKAEYFVFGRTHDAYQVDCNSYACPRDSVEVSCPPDLCDYMPCPKYKGTAKCRVDNCTQCHVDFMVNGQPIEKDDCFDRPVCTAQKDPNCNKAVCRASFCPGDMNIWCRMNDCGGCKAEWYNSTNGDIISCPYYDELLQKAPEQEKHVASTKEPDAHVKNIPVVPAEGLATTKGDGTNDVTGQKPLTPTQKIAILKKIIQVLLYEQSKHQQKIQQQEQNLEHSTIEEKVPKKKNTEKQPKKRGKNRPKKQDKRQPKKQKKGQTKAQTKKAPATSGPGGVPVGTFKKFGLIQGDKRDKTHG